MKHVKNNPDVSDWNLEAIEKFGEQLSQAIGSAVNEALGYALKDPDTYICFPVEWGSSDGIGGAAVKDPLTVYLRVALHGDSEQPTYAFNLREALSDSIETCAEDGSFSDGLGRLAEELRNLAAEIDAAREKSNTPELSRAPASA